MTKRLLISLLSAGCLLSACAVMVKPGAQPATATPTADITATPMVATTAAPTATPTPLPTALPPTKPPVIAAPTLSPPTLSAEQIATYTAELSSTVAALLPPSPTPDATGYAGPTFEGVTLWPLTSTNATPLWVAYSTGIRDFVSNINHFIALYTREATGWRQVLKFDLLNADYMNPDSVQQVAIDPTHIWLAVNSGAGAHSGCIDLYAIDAAFGPPLNAVAHCSDHPGGGEVRDLNGDGQLDVILDQTDSYVFCYACGVRYFIFSVLNWNGTQFVEQTLTPLPDSAPADFRQAVNRAVELANGGLWQAAQAQIEQSGAAQAADPIARWNAAIIDLNAQAWRDQVFNQPYPLLDNLFYGDYAATLNVMRPYPPDQLFSLTGPLIKGTVAETWESTLSFWIAKATDGALKAQPDLAAAYFLRGWAAYLVDKRSPAAVADIEKAATLDPNEKLFSESVEFLK